MKQDTLITHAGRDPSHLGIVNPPVYHCSTVLFPDYATVLETRKDRASGESREVTYGREGTPLTRYFEEAVAALEGGYKAVTLPCGMGAIAATLTALLRAGDHLLVLDAVYGPCRDFCSNVLTRFGVEVEYYDPLVGAGIAQLMRPNTRVVYVESPCSLTFEVQDIPAIAAAAHARGAKVVMDNTWASPLFFKAIGHGVVVAIHAATKYLSGHSDLMLGVAVHTRETDTAVRQNASRFGYSAGPDDVYNALRGLRTLGVRMGSTRRGRSRSRAGCSRVRRWTGSSTRRCRRTRATRSGSATSWARRALWAWCSRTATRGTRSHGCSTRCNSSGSATAGVGSRAWPCRPSRKRCARRPSGAAALRSGCTSVWRTRRTS